MPVSEEEVTATHRCRYAFMKDDIPELRAIGKTMVVVVEADEGSTSVTVLDAATFKNGSSELQEYLVEWLREKR